MTAKQAEALFRRIGGQVFDDQWREARAYGLTDERIAELWALRSFQPPADWKPPPRGDEQPRGE